VRSVSNRRDKEELVQQGLAHGILVYADGEPIGWCQYGSREELPRIDDSPKYRTYKENGDKLWRITCFVVDKRYRRKGVGSIALKAALESIRKKGGGLVEAYPLKPFDKLRESELRERGHASSFGNVSTHGTVSMFKKQGFKEVGPYGSRNVVMRKILRRG
jgi:GNAT superfamily N-acetyltransferase